MARVVVMCGLPGSGKTTVAREVEAAYPAVRLCPDDWLQSLGFAAYDQAARRRVEALQGELARTLVGQGVDVVLENGFWSRAERDEVRAWARDHGHEVELRFLDAPAAELQARIERRNATLAPGGFRVDPADLPGWSAAIERPDPAELAGYDPPRPTGG